MKAMLRYSHPALEFKNGLPIGNGRLAAMVCGDEKTVRLALNHEWLWRGVNRYRDFDDVSSHLDEVRKPLLEGDFLTGTRLANDYFGGAGGRSGRPCRVDPYSPAGDLLISTRGGSHLRTLDLSTGEAVVHSGNACVRAFVSFADGFLVVKRTADTSVALTRTEEDKDCDIIIEGLSLDCQFHGGVSFRIRAREYVHGNEITLLLDIATSANEGELLAFPEDADYDQLFARHLPVFAAAMGPAKLDVELPDCDLDTDVRLANYKAGGDPAMPLLYFEYGRYLMVSGSSGELPLNLQGKWNEDVDPPWQSDYHLDVNLEMAYWPCNALGLHRQLDTMFNLAERYVPHGREMARKLYGCGGICFCIQTDVWGRMTPESYGWAVWIGAAAWLGSHFTRHWHYTRDEKFLRERAYPFLKEVAAFYQDYLIKRGDKYVIVPSQSPENRFEGTGDSFPVSIGYNSAMDIQLATDTLRACLEMAEYLHEDAPLQAVWAEMLANMPALSVDSLGRLNEFDSERAEPEPGHRHLSHLYGLYPGEMFPDGNPLRAACVKSLDARLSHGGGHTGWSRSWVACLMARLGRTADFCHHLTALICDFATESLLDLHPPRIFQIDGNMGGTAAICEALMSCEDRMVTLLGALPAEWKNGSFDHMKAPGNLDVCCRWKGGAAKEVRVYSPAGGEWTLQVNGQLLRLALAPGEEKTLNF